MGSARVVAAIVAVLVVASGAGCKKKARQPVSVPRPPPAVVVKPEVVRPMSGGVGSTIALAEIGARTIAIVADEDERGLSLVDLAAPEGAGRPAVEHDLGGEPGQIVVSRRGVVYAAVRGASRVVALEARTDGKLHEIASRDTASEPFGLALTPAEDLLVVTTGWGHTVEGLRPADLAPVFVKDVPREPRAVVVTDDGKRAFVSHAVGSTLTVVDLATDEHAARAVPLAMKERRLDFGMTPSFLPMPMARKTADPFEGPRVHEPPLQPVRFTFTRRANQGFSLASIGGEILVPEVLVLPGDDETSFSGYGAPVGSTLPTHVPFVGRVDGAKEKLADDHFSGGQARRCFEEDRTPQCLLPAAAVAVDGKLLVACAGIDRVVSWDPKAKYDEGDACGKARRERRSWPTGKHPTGIAADAEKHAIYTWSPVERAVTRIALEGGETRTTRLAPRRSPVTEAVARGRDLFYTTGDPRISKNGRACASCHPDGRQDEIVWPTPNGKRQTPMLAGRLEGTAPYDWNGSHDTLPVHIAATVHNLEGKGLEDADLDALSAYVSSLQGPYVKWSDDARVAEGRRVFESSEASCSSCHVEESRFTDRQVHAIDGRWRPSFDTPSLRFVGGTAPYFHDGRYATLEELVDKCDGKMGKTAHLGQKEKEALVSYLRSL